MKMSRYTTQLRYLLENPDWTDERIGLGNYPLFDEGYRERLNKVIKDYFYFDEIGSETPYRFSHRLRTKMNVIMPYYNQLYQSALLEIEPFLTMNYSVKSHSTLQEILNSIKQNKQASNGLENGASNKDSKSTSINTSTESGKENDLKTLHDLAVGADGKRMGYASVDHGHSLDISSDTPEGFIQTETIEAGNYANTANKNEFRNEKDGHDSVNDNYIHDSYKYDTGQADSEKNSVNSGSNAMSDISFDTKNTIFNQLVDELADIAKNQSNEGLQEYQGFNGKSMAEMVNELRSTFLNIDQMILNELEVLFISILN